MAETPEELYERARGALRMPPVGEWDTFPFDGDMRPRALEPPAASEEPREGEGGSECAACNARDDDYLWTSESWRLTTLGQPSGLPVIVLLESREHFDGPADLPPEIASEMGLVLARVERAVKSVEHVGRVHVCRWGDGSSHLHWWFMGRPARLGQLRGSFAAIWDDVLPPTPEDVWRANVDQVVAHLRESEPSG
jgi:diadenosine tetraphosphate (Ap4A) HIT family hydrolase